MGDEMLLRAEQTMRSFERADSYRRQRLRWRRPMVLSPLQHIFYEFKTRLLYQGQVRRQVIRHQARMRGLRVRAGLRRWRQRSRALRGWRLCWARYSRQVKGTTWAIWAKSAEREARIRGCCRRLLLQRARLCLQRASQRAKEAKDRCERRLILFAVLQ
jgi:hypothetical protein